MNKHYIHLILLVVLLLVVGCSSKTESTDAVKAPTEETSKYPVGSDEEQIHTMLNNALIRLSYGDKSDLYELEYEYFLDDKTFDDYLKLGEISYARMDSILRIDIDSIMFFGDDSAWAIIQYVFKDWKGEEKSRRRDKMSVYKHKGRWIKPTVSTTVLQMQYDARIDEAIRSAQQEAEEEAAGK